MNTNDKNSFEVKELAQNQRVYECPNCSYPLVISKDASSASCPCCASMINVNQPHVEVDKVSDKIFGIKTVSAAKVHIDFLFETYDWEAFSKNASIFSIKEIDVLLDNIKTSQGDDKETWKLCFEYVAMCVNQKIKNIDKNINAVIQKYINGANVNNCHNDYDAIKEGVKILKGKQEQFLADLQNYLNYAQRFGLEDSEVGKLNKAMNDIAEAFNHITVVDRLEDHPEVAAEITKKMTELEEKYQAQGIDAIGLYDSALNDFEEGKYADALSKFSQISVYRDASKYIKKINRTLVVNKDIVYLHNQLFYDCDGLYPFKAKLIDNDVKKTLFFNTYWGCFGNRFYYFDKEDASVIHYLDVEADPKAKKDKKNPFPTIKLYGTILTDELSFNDDFPNLVNLLVKYDPNADAKERKAFFTSNNIKLDKQFVKVGNDRSWCDLLSLDLATGKVKLLVERVNNIVDFVGNVIYYIAPLPVFKKQKLSGYDGTGLYAYNLSTNEVKLAITGNARIQYINADKSIIFTRNDHGEHNYTIYTRMSLESEEEKVVVKNVYQFYQYINGKVFYLVGNKKVKSLCSINLDGSNYLEVMKYMQDVAFSDEDWIYITRGEGDFCTLYRIPITGGKPQKVAFGMYKTDVTDDNCLIHAGYIYYRNFNNVLCRVRLNGTGYQELVLDVYGITAIDYDKIFYVCLDEVVNGKKIISLYNMNMDGSNRQKLIHNVKDIKKLDEQYFLFVRDEELETQKTLYADIDNPKLQKQIDKMYKLFAKKRKNTHMNLEVIWQFDYQECESKLLAYVAFYPTKKTLKAQKKEIMAKK